MPPQRPLLCVAASRRKPRRCSHRLPDETVAAIERLRRERLTGPQIAHALDLPRSTVGAILRRLDLGRLSALEPKPPVVRYERAAPGELIHIDTKKLGRIDGIGHRITGDRRGRNRGIGWDLVHVCIDDASRLAYTEIRKRPYRMRERAKSQEQTRLTIVEATMQLHEELGPRNTTITEIAKRAGVQRLTVYSHFPDETAVFQACTSHWLSLNPPPDPASWSSIEDPGLRFRAANLGLLWVFQHDKADVGGFIPRRCRGARVTAAHGRCRGLSEWGRARLSRSFPTPHR